MSKEKRQKRFQQKNRHIERQFGIAKTNNHHYYNDNNKHRLHKMRAMDCGNPNCYMCGNPRKFFKERSRQEISFDQTRKWVDY